MYLHLSPMATETASEFVARLRQAWDDVTPAEPEPADEPSEADRAWNAAHSPLNELECPDDPAWDERWTVTGAEEWTADRDAPADDPDYVYEWEEQELAEAGLDWDAAALESAPKSSAIPAARDTSPRLSPSPNRKGRADAAPDSLGDPGRRPHALRGHAGIPQGG